MSVSAREQLLQYARFNSEAILRSNRDQRWRALRDSALAYNQAISSYLGFILDARSKMTYNIDRVGVVENLTIADLNTLKAQIGPIGSVRRSLDGAVSSFIGDWPPGTRQRMLAVVNTGQRIGECLEAASASPTNQEEANFIKRLMVVSCAGVASNFVVFMQDSRKLSKELARIVYQASVAASVRGSTNE